MTNAGIAKSIGPRAGELVGKETHLSRSHLTGGALEPSRQGDPPGTGKKKGSQFTATTQTSETRRTV